jgi:glycerophosphoryl diester phosphodiesterase
LGFTPDVYSPYFQLLSKEKVQQLHALGMKVIPWTVNTTEEMKRIKAMKVDGIITDYPDRIPH